MTYPYTYAIPCAYGAVLPRAYAYGGDTFAIQRAKYNDEDNDALKAVYAKRMTEDACCLEVHTGMATMCPPHKLAVLVDMATNGGSDVSKAIAGVLSSQLKSGYPNSAIAIQILDSMPDSVLASCHDALATAAEAGNGTSSQAYLVWHRVSKAKAAKEEEDHKKHQAASDLYWGALGAWGCPAPMTGASYTVPSTVFFHSGGTGLGYPSNAWAAQYMVHGTEEAKKKAMADWVSHAPAGWTSTSYHFVPKCASGALWKAVQPDTSEDDYKPFATIYPAITLHR